MKNVLGNARFWGGGVLAALCGVVLARVVAPHSEHRVQLWLTVGGQLIALGGLLLICVGVSRRVSRAHDEPGTDRAK